MGKKTQTVGRSERILRNYLSQYYKAAEQMVCLHERLRSIREELGGDDGRRGAALACREDEIESRIEEQRKVVEADLLKIMDIIDYLDPASEERKILELYYIDKLPWKSVQEKTHISRSSCYEKRDRGIRELLTYKRIRELVEAYAQTKGL